MKEFKTRPSQKLYFMRIINGAHNKKIFSEDLHKNLVKTQYSSNERSIAFTTLAWKGQFQIGKKIGSIFFTMNQVSKGN